MPRNPRNTLFPPSIFYLLFIVLFSGKVFSESLILFDGETPLTCIGKPGPYFETWWGGAKANFLTNSKDNPHSGKQCMKWTCRVAWSGGSLMKDPSWLGINIEPMTNLEFWARGEKGGESVAIKLYDKWLGKPSENDGHFTEVKIENIPAQWTRYSFTLQQLTNKHPGKRGPDLNMFEGFMISGSQAETTVYFDDMKIGMAERQEVVYSPIKINHIGYRTNDRKYAILNKKVDSFELVDATTKKAVFSGKPELITDFDRESGDLVMVADFTALKTPGSYFVRLPDGSKTGPFTIAGNVYEKLLKDSIRTYYYQRCGIELEPKYALKWTHEKCHTNDIRTGYGKGNDGTVTSGTLDETGGWHDAGDDNKYSWNYDMLWTLARAYQLFPQKFPDGQLNIPESGNGRSDLLDEIVYETKWFIKMQVPSGKEEGLAFEQMRDEGGNDKVPYLQYHRKLKPPGSDCTLNYCASMALMAFILGREKDKDSLDLAGKCGAAALKAWNAYVKFTKNGNISYPGGKKTGYVMDRLKALTELYRMTGDKKFNDMIKKETDQHIAVYKAGDFTWGAGKFIPYFTYCSMPETLTDPVTANKMKDVVRNWKKIINHYVASNAYRVPFGGKDHFCWGSNSHLAAFGMIFYHLYLWDGLDEDLQKVKRVTDYLMGLNAVDKIMYTGEGQPTLIFHGIWAKDKNNPDSIPPGYLAGGVNSGEGRWISKFNQKCYKDTVSNWTVNENSTGFQAPAVFCLAPFVP